MSDSSGGVSTTSVSEETGDPASFCGDGVVQPPEACDDQGESAMCDADCSLSGCGDLNVNRTAGEECETGDLGGSSCAELGFEEGELACSRDCQFDVSQCAPQPFSLDHSQTKRFDFSWAEVEGAESYRILERVTPSADPQELGSNTTELSATFEMPLHLRGDASYTLQACGGDGRCTDVDTLDVDERMTDSIGYLEDVDSPTLMGRSLAMTPDGGTIAAPGQGGIRIFSRTGPGTWEQQPTVPPPGGSGRLDISADGSTLAIAESTFFPSFVRVLQQAADGTWNEEAVLSTPTGLGHLFGRHVSISDDGETIAVGAASEPSGSAGVGGDMFDASVSGAGAVFVYERLADGSWVLQGYLKHSDPAANDHFAANTFFDGGNGIFVGSSSSSAGPAIHEFVRDADGVWSARGMIPVVGYEQTDQFDTRVAASDDGNVVAVGSENNNNEEVFSGAVHVYARTDSDAPWTEIGFLKAPSPTGGDNFGHALDVSGDGQYIVAGSTGEDSGGVGITNTTDQELPGSGAAYVFAYDSGPMSWELVSIVKASNPTTYDNFGSSVSLNTDGSTLAVGAQLGSTDNDEMDEKEPMGIYVY